MPNRTDLHSYNQYTTDLSKKGVSLPSDTAVVTVVGDDLAPGPVESLYALSAPNGIRLEWVNPSTNADGTTCYDMAWAKIYYSSATGVSTTVNDGHYIAAGRAGNNQAFTDTNLAAGITRYYTVTAIDGNSNESAIAAEVHATSGAIEQDTDIPDDATGLIFDDSFGTQGIVTGDGMLGVVFLQPSSAWRNFDHYRLWYAVDAGTGFGAWTEIEGVSRNGYVFKGLTPAYYYRFKATVVSTDGVESTTPDKAKTDDTGYQPNSSDNSLLVAVLVLAENIVATNEVRGDHFCATSYLSINSSTFGSKGIQLQYNSGTPRFYAGDGANAFIKHDGTKLTWKATNTQLDASGNLIATSATLSGAITATSGSIGGFTIGAAALTAGSGGTAVGIAPATYPFYAGNATAASAPFRVSTAGALVATSATITGAITATSGTIGGFTIGASALTAGAGGTAVGIAPATYPFYAGNATPASAPFKVTSAGVLYASGAVISGSIACGSGSSYYGLGSLATLSTVGASNCDTTIISGGKIITGLLTATNITVGTMTADRISGGTIGACTISANNITTGGMNAARITAGTINASVISVTNLNADNITAGTITGRALRTAASGARAVIDNGIFGAAGTITMYDSAGALRTWLTGGRIIGLDSSANITFELVNYAGAASYAAKFWQSSSTAAVPVLYLQQDDSDQPFINFQGYSGLSPIVSFADSTKAVIVSLNGTRYRIPLWNYP
ncbi:MAG: hypothetical protein WC657_05585 [Candidatus Paceibacterota bacterium]|jgi:hypothetical protein